MADDGFARARSIHRTRWATAIRSLRWRRGAGRAGKRQRDRCARRRRARRSDRPGRVEGGVDRRHSIRARARHCSCAGSSSDPANQSTPVHPVQRERLRGHDLSTAALGRAPAIVSPRQAGRDAAGRRRPATSATDGRSSGAVAIDRRGCWSNTPRPRSSRTCCGEPDLRHSRRPTSPRGSSSPIFRPISASSTASRSRTSPTCAPRASR